MIDVSDFQTRVLDFMNGKVPGVVPDDISKKDADRYRKATNNHERLQLTSTVHTEQFYQWKGHYLQHQPTAIAFGQRFLVVAGEYPRLLNSPQGQDILEQVIFEVINTPEYDNLPFWRSFLTMDYNDELRSELEEHRRKQKKTTVLSKPTKKATLF